MSSRVIIKNLPKYMTQARLKTIFGEKGTITDCKLVTTKEGTFRRFAYVGFKTNLEADAAVTHFNRTFIDTCKIEVQLAFSIGSQDLARPWSKYSAGSSANPVKTTVEKKEEFLKEVLEVDPKLQEYLHVMKSKNSNENKTWGNDDLAPSASAVAKPGKNDDDLYEDLVASKTAAHELVDLEPPLDAKASIANAPEISDMEYLRSKKPPIDKAEVVNVHPSRLLHLEGNGAVSDNIINTFESISEPIIEKPTTVQEQIVQEQLAEPYEEVNVDLIADTGRLMVRNLAYTCTSPELKEIFEGFGPLVEVHIPIGRETKISKGYAFVLFLMPENAVKAYEALDKTIFQGRILEIVPAKEKPQAEEKTEVRTGFKAGRERGMKQNSGSSFNWNSLFMNSDAVAEAMARKLGVQKHEILDTRTDNMAVRLALAETNIISDTKTYLEEQGVSLDSFQTGQQKRSAKVILVKNISSRTEEDDLIELFGGFGTLGRIVLPPSRTIALVEFQEENEAKAAFKKLAYSKFNNLPLFLEWAPASTFLEAYDAVAIAKKNAERVVVKQAPTITKAKESELKTIVDDADPEAMPVATVFVKNLNFETTDQGLKSAFDCPGLRSVRIVRKTDPKSGQRLSMGFGFLEFNQKEDAMTCIKTMQKLKLDNHELLLKFSNSVSKAVDQKRKVEDVEITGTKLLVRNIPFEATKKDLKQLFKYFALTSNFGQVKSVRLPTQFDGRHRGFGFIDFLTLQEAKSAYSSLGATHLYGRHLVLEWAQDEQSVDALRAKTARKYVKTDANKKIQMEGDEEMEE